MRRIIRSVGVTCPCTDCIPPVNTRFRTEIRRRWRQTAAKGSSKSRANLRRSRSGAAQKRGRRWREFSQLLLPFLYPFCLLAVGGGRRSNLVVFFSVEAKMGDKKASSVTGAPSGTRSETCCSIRDIRAAHTPRGLRVGGRAGLFLGEPDKIAVGPRETPRDTIWVPSPSHLRWHVSFLNTMTDGRTYSPLFPPASHSATRKEGPTLLFALWVSSPHLTAVKRTMLLVLRTSLLFQHSSLHMPSRCPSTDRPMFPSLCHGSSPDISVCHVNVLWCS